MALHVYAESAFSCFAGVASRLDHLVELGVDAISLGPVFQSAMLDAAGNDVTDFTAIDHVLGTMADFRDLVAQAHEKGYAQFDAQNPLNLRGNFCGTCGLGINVSKGADPELWPRGKTKNQESDRGN